MNFGFFLFITYNLPLRLTNFELRSLFFKDFSELAIFIIFKPGNVLLSHILRQSTIGAEGLYFRVRNGIGCCPFAIITRQRLIIFLKDLVNSLKHRFYNIYGGRNKNWTYDLFDVNEAFYHWTIRPWLLNQFKANKFNGNYLFYD